MTKVIEIDRVTSVFPCPGEGEHRYISERDVARNETVLVCERHLMSARVPDTLLRDAIQGARVQTPVWQANVKVDTVNTGATHGPQPPGMIRGDSAMERARQLHRAKTT